MGHGFRHIHQQKQAHKQTLSQQQRAVMLHLPLSAQELGRVLEEETRGNEMVKEVIKARPVEHKIPQALGYSGQYETETKSREDKTYDRKDEKTPSIREHLLEQVKMLEKVSDRDKKAAECVIECLNERGLLYSKGWDLHKMVAAECKVNLSEAELQSGVELVQFLDPAGVGAQSVQEMILIQLLRSGQYNTESDIYKIVRDHYDLFVQKEINDLFRAEEMKPEEIRDIIFNSEDFAKLSKTADKTEE